MWLVEKEKMVQVHCTIDLEGLRDQINGMDGGSTCCHVWHQMNNVSSGYCVRPIKKRWVLHKARGIGKHLKSYWLLEI